MVDELTVQFLLRQGWIAYDVKSQMKESEDARNFREIVKIMLEMTDNNEMNSYYLAEGLVKILKNHQCMDLMIKSFFASYESSNLSLFHHCDQIGLNKQIPLETWFRRGFSGTLHEDSVIRIFDKVIGGCQKILIFVGLEILRAHMQQLLYCKSSNDALKILTEKTFVDDEGSSRIITQKAFDAWVNDGSKLYFKESTPPNNFDDEINHLVNNPLSLDSSSKDKFELVTEIKLDDNSCD